MLPDNQSTLYYVHDPMCSWCWGFHKTWSQVEALLIEEGKVKIEYLVGGLAPDSNEPMSDEMRAAIPSYWRRIQDHIPGTEFNYDFWEKCEPRRSTYPSCRAVLTAKLMDPSKEKDMIVGIQQAYYLQAKNPSDDSTLIDVANSIGLDKARFAKQLNSDATNKLFSNQLQLTFELGARSFPSLVLKKGRELHPISYDYNSVKATLSNVRQHL